MTDNNNSNSDKKPQNIIKKYINLLNSLILSLKNNPLKDLQELSDESNIYKLIVEIEPNFEKTPFNNKVELINDLNLENRYNNFVTLFNAVEKYNNESKTKDKFTKETNFTKTIIINDLINNDLEQLLKIAEMLCFLTIISSNKNYFIEKVNEIDDNQISNLYYSIIEKYITFKIDESTSSVVKKANLFTNQVQVQNVKTFNLKSNVNKNFIRELNLRELPNLVEEQSRNIINPPKTIIITGYEDIISDKEEGSNKNKNISNIINYENLNKEYEKEKTILQDEINNLNKEITKWKENNQNLEKDKKKLEENVIELKDINNKLQEEIIENKNKEEMKEKNEYNTINKELNDVYQIIENLKKENFKLNKIIDQINNDKINLEIKLKDAELNIQKLNIENEKIKDEEKIKENNYNENFFNDKKTINNLKEELNNQIKINEKIKKENQLLISENEKYKNEIINNIINQNKENNKNAINENNTKDSITTSNENELKTEIQKLKQKLEEKDEKIKKLEEINLEKEKDKGEDVNFYKKSYEEQKIRVNEEHKLISESLYKLAIHFMTLKDDLQKRINSSNTDK